MYIPYKEHFNNVSEYKIARDIAVCQMYKDNILTGQIAQQLSIERHTVVRILKNNNLYDPKRSKIHLDQRRIDRNEQIYQMHKKGFTSRQIAEKLGIGKTNVNIILTKFYDIPKGTRECSQRWRRHHVDKYFFKTIDTEQKAYWLGFLYADGCITEKSVRLELAIKDQCHLEKLQKTLQARSYPLYLRNDIDSCVLVINSKEMADDLINNGCCIRKTHTLHFPCENIVSIQLLHHFMRGYFDGDGCIHASKKNIYFSIVGTDVFVAEYQKQVMVGINKTTTVQLQSCGTNIVSLHLGGKQQCKKIYNFLYHDAHIFLERKKVIFESLF